MARQRERDDRASVEYAERAPSGTVAGLSSVTAADAPSSLGGTAPDPRALETLDLEVHLATPTLNQRYVTAIFDIVAPRYDQFTRWFSFGMDAAWKRDLLARAAQRDSPIRVAVDLACGTGDLALGVGAKAPMAQVVGLDVSRRMLHLAQAKARAKSPEGGVVDATPRRIAWCAGNLCRLPFPDASIDLVTAGYAVRNAPLWTAALDEIARVLKPGGVLLSLDFFKPANRLWRGLFLSYLGVSGRAYGWLWHRAPPVYGYIAPSIARFTTADEFAVALTDRGLRVEAINRRLGGGIALHVARRD